MTVDEGRKKPNEGEWNTFFGVIKKNNGKKKK